MKDDFSGRLEMVYTISYKYFRVTVFWQIGCGDAIKLGTSGNYAIWVQVKSAGEVITQKFDFEVIL